MSNPTRNAISRANRSARTTVKNSASSLVSYKVRDGIRFPVSERLRSGFEDDVWFNVRMIIRNCAFHSFTGVSS